ncbi:MAG: hypothetical protein ACOC4G_08715, partial [Bacillota bacterium]
MKYKLEKVRYMRKPDFKNILKVLKNKKPERPTLFEFFLNQPLYQKLTVEEDINTEGEMGRLRLIIHAFKNAGYDYVTLHGSDFFFPVEESHSLESISLNEGTVIANEEDFNKIFAGFIEAISVA